MINSRDLEARRAARRARPVELRKLIPNMLTAAALICGCAAMYFADKGIYDKAIAMIGVSFVLDGLDGRIARMLKATSRFGEKFDSIADFVAFGFAPAFIIFKWQLHTLNAFGLVVTGVYALCAAYRLARFTRMAKKKDVNAPVSKFFMGFPAPAASGAMLVPPMLQLSELQWVAPVGATIAWTLLISFLMVSKLPMISVKHIKVNRKLALPIVILFGTILLLAFRDAWLTFAGLAMLYALSLPGGWLLSRRSITKEASEAALHQTTEPRPEPSRRS